MNSTYFDILLRDVEPPTLKTHLDLQSPTREKILKSFRSDQKINFLHDFNKLLLKIDVNGEA